MKKVYIVRHCEAEGQQSDAILTKNGFYQAMQLANFFEIIPINRIISSHYQRAIKSIQPLADNSNLDIEIDERLAERVLSNRNLIDWLGKLRDTYDNYELKFDGGESSREVMQRIVQVVNETFEDENENTVIVTHGNIMSLLLNYYDDRFGFEEWRRLSNPDVFVLKLDSNKVTCKHIWKLGNLTEM